MDYHIIGTGPVGQLLATLLIDEGYQATLISRKSGVDPVKETIKLDPLGKQTRYLIRQTTWKELRSKEVHTLLICTKAQDAFDAFERSPKTANKIFLNNGMGPQQSAWVQQKRTVYWGSNTHGSYINATGQLVHAGEGSLIVGSPNRISPVLSLPSCFQWSANIEQILWDKLAINALINPLTLKFDCKNGDLLTNNKAIDWMEKLGHEIDEIRKAKQVFNSTSFEMALQVAKATANNWSSSVQDMRLNKRTELDFICTYAQRTAQSMRIKTPALDAILDELRPFL